MSLMLAIENVLVHFAGLIHKATNRLVVLLQHSTIKAR